MSLCSKNIIFIKFPKIFPFASCLTRCSYFSMQLKAITYDQSKANALKKQITLFSDLPVTPVFSVVNAKLHARALRVSVLTFYCDVPTY